MYYNASVIYHLKISSVPPCEGSTAGPHTFARTSRPCNSHTGIEIGSIILRSRRSTAAPCYTASTISYLIGTFLVTRDLQLSRTYHQYYLVLCASQLRSRTLLDPKERVASEGVRRASTILSAALSS